jgi:hypothetical protein
VIFSRVDQHIAVRRALNKLPASLHPTDAVSLILMLTRVGVDADPHEPPTTMIDHETCPIRNVTTVSPKRSTT